jgi:SAM-dependent methyltransferase
MLSFRKTAKTTEEFAEESMIHRTVFILLGYVAMLALPSWSTAQDRETKVRNDRKTFEGEGYWIYNDLQAGFAEAAKSNKPLLVVIRCIPCEACAQGHFELLLTPNKPVPTAWFPPLPGTAALCLAGGGGQQGPLLAGAVVTVFDNSPSQLEQDRLVADREGLAMETVEGDMADLSLFADATFDLIVHPVSNCFVPDVRPVWRECYRVLRAGGVLLAGFTNAVRYLFDDERAQNGSLEVRFAIPYSDTRDLGDDRLRELVLAPMHPLEFGHTLATRLAGSLTPVSSSPAFTRTGAPKRTAT